MTLPARFTILVADDDPDDRELVADAVRDAGLAHAELHFVTDGVETVDALTGGLGVRPDLILLDLNMPRMDGREVMARLREDEALRSIPVVVLTTSGSESDVRMAYESGANSYIVKPVTYDGLIHVMRELGRYWTELVRLPDPAAR